MQASQKLHALKQPAPTTHTKSDISVLIPDSRQVLEYLGSVNHDTNQQLFAEMKKRLQRNSAQEIVLTVSSSGGPTGAGMCFYDMVRHILHPKLVTVGSGDVDSSGIIVFLAGTKRLVTAHTTMLLHMAGRYFDPNVRYTTSEMNAMLREDTLKDEQYARVIADNTEKLTEKDVLTMMEHNTVLTPVEMVDLGIAHALLA